jgi:nicotinamide-nucleotide amidase
MTERAATIAVLTIGDELLSGEIHDSNFPTLARAFTGIGLTVGRHATVADDEEAIATAVLELASDADALIITGGLGPTSDDLTTESVAKAAGRRLEFHEHIASNLRAFFEAMGRPMSEENLKQAYLPEGAVEIPTEGGTAPGFMLEHGGALIAALPGVPREMEAMLTSHVLPELKRRFACGAVSITRRIMTFGAGEADIAGMVGDLIGKGPVRYGFLALGGPVAVKITAESATADGARAVLDAEEARIRERVGALAYGVDEQSMEEVLGELLREKGLTVAVAESTTGGLVCGLITTVPGSSDYFLGGIVSYSIGAKASVLDIPSDLLAGGAVSVEVARAMADSVRRLFGADIGVAVTGVAGPGSGGEKKPVGTICLGLAHEGGTESWEVRLPGDRQLVRSISTMAVMQVVRVHLLEADASIGWLRDRNG